MGVERPGSLDPAQAQKPGELLLAENLFSALTKYDSTSLAVKPAIASQWQASPDMTQWDFTIRPDAKFNNGRPITADDVKYTFERITRRGSPSRAAAQLQMINGFAPFSLTGKADTLAGVTAPAPNVVHIALDGPLSALPAVLGNPAFGIVPRESVEAQPPAPAFADQPVGSGPFMVESRTESTLHLVPAPGTQLALKAVDIYMAHDSAGSYADFLGGGLDWAEVPPDQVAPATPKASTERSQPYAGELFYAFNVKNPKYADVRFREAIVRAVDRDAIVQVIYGGAVKPLSGIVADGIPGYQPDACGDKCRHDPARARDLVKQVFGDAPPPEVQIDFNDDLTQQAVARAIQANLKEVGIPAALRPKPFADYSQFFDSGQQEMFRLGWIAAYPT
ncbi:MAG: ABC transporter substrate-binding protein, partial [Actinomycetota bacterium]|nr:ABC transporter substrate-binding protein [Actinomycetota bacterium]